MNEPSNSGQKPSQALCTAELRRNAHVLVLQEMRTRFSDAGSPSRTAALDAAIAALSPQPSPATCKEGLQVQPSPGGQGDLKSRFTEWVKANSYNPDTFASGRFMGDGVQIAWEAVQAFAARQPVGEPVEMSPEFTDTARAAIAWVLWHHQGGSSPVGQPLRFSLGMGQHDRMTDHQIAEAKRFAAWAGVTSEGFHHHSPAQAVDLPYSLDADPAGIRARVADVITGTLMVGAQGHTPPPAGHWAEPFWKAARADATAQAVDLEEFRDAVEEQHASIMDMWRGDPETKAAADAQRDRLLALIDGKAVGNG